MIQTDRELETTQERIRQFERQVAQIRKAETDPGELPDVGWRIPCGD